MMITPVPCAHCAQLFTPLHAVTYYRHLAGKRVYCSKPCARTRKVAQQIAQMVCPICNVTFVPCRTQYYGAKENLEQGKQANIYCSRKCSGIAHTLYRPEDKFETCTTCGKLFELGRQRTSLKANGKQTAFYCSRECVGNGKPQRRKNAIKDVKYERF